MEINKNDYEIVYISIVYLYFTMGIFYMIDGSIPRNYIIIILAKFIIFSIDEK